MQQRTQRRVAAFLVAAALAVPAPALAGPPRAPAGSAAAAGSVPAPPAPDPTLPPPDPALPSPDPASLQVSRDQAIAMARRTFAIPGELGEPNVTVHQSPHGATWYLNWQKPGKQPELLTIGVAVDGVTGEILHYSRWRPAPESSAPLRYGREEAFRLAQEWLAKLAAAEQASLRLREPSPGYGYGGAGPTHVFHWDRLQHGYPVRGGGISIAINAGTGELESFDRGAWRGASYPLPAAILTREQAEAAYRQGLPMALQYRRFYQPGVREGEWRLVYAPLPEFYPLMDQEGRLLDRAGQPLDPAALRPGELVPAADQPYRPPQQPLTREQALALAQAVLGRQDAPAQSQYGEQGEGEQKRSTWTFEWSKAGELAPGEYNGNAQVDAVRGVVLSFNRWGPEQPLQEDEEPPVTEAAARALAIAFLRTHRPDLAGQVMVVAAGDTAYKEKLAFVKMKPSAYSIRFIHLQGGIPVFGAWSTVTVDARTGALRSFWSYREGDGSGTPGGWPADLPAAEGLISPEAALDAFLQHQGLEAAWHLLPTPPRPGGPAGPGEPAPRLVWAPADRWPVTAIDARTGALLDDQGRDVIAAARRPQDIAGHWAEKEIELLWSRGIVTLENGQFHPGRPATAAELARWLVLARGLSPLHQYAFAQKLGDGAVAERVAASPAAPYFGAALEAGIVLPEDFTADASPEAPVTREVFALWAVRALGYAPIARMPNRIEVPFVDRAQLGARYANAVAILHGLGIVQGESGGAYAPQRPITRAEAARIVFAIATREPRYLYPVGK